MFNALFYLSDIAPFPTTGEIFEVLSPYVLLGFISIGVIAIIILTIFTFVKLFSTDKKLVSEPKKYQEK